MIHGPIRRARGYRLYRVRSGGMLVAAGLFLRAGVTAQFVYRLIEPTERERCLSNDSMSYDDYRRGTDARKKD